jgi:RNA polymerase sigma-70 factor (ECF subfamily)
LEYRAGNEEDFDRLYRAIYQRIYATLVMILNEPAAAEDAAQEAFLRGFRAWATWKGDAPAEAWMHRIALNVAFSYRRREQLRTIGKLLMALGSPYEPDPADLEHIDLQRELHSLPPKQAAALVLRHLHGYTNREIAFALSVPERTVASRLAAAKSRLRAHLGDRINKEMGTGGSLRVPFDE